MTNRILVGAVFLVGCAVGGASSQLVVPKASAQQAAQLTKWEMLCLDIAKEDGADIAKEGNKAGLQGWEPVGADAGTWCWKRPKL